MDRYLCVICGYVYDPAVGDAESGIEPGTPFEDLPEDWVCPIKSGMTRSPRLSRDDKEAALRFGRNMTI